MTWSIIRPIALLLFMSTLPILPYGALLMVLALFGPMPMVVGMQVTAFGGAFLLFDATLWLLAYGKTRETAA